jgi:methylmalonyl-CoA mutase
MPETEPQAVALAAEFATATREDWRAQVAAVLRKSGLPDGADPEEALSTALLDGPEVKPLYTAADVDVPPTGLPGATPYVRGATASRAGWDVRALHADPDPARTNAVALADLTNGATSLWLRIGGDGTPSSRTEGSDSGSGCAGGGIAVADLPAALDGVYLDLAPIVLDAGAQTEQAARALLTFSDQRGVARAELSGSLGADPIGLRARTGAEADLALLPALAEQRSGAPNLLVATVDGTVYHDGGASDADELAIATAVGVAYLRALSAAGRSVDEALGAIEFRLAVTDDQFTAIAKLRAARRLWGRVAQLCGASPNLRGQRQHAVTSAAMMTQRDPWVNMLRTTIACFAAAVGGADAITVLPFDSAIGLPDDFARRIARNTQSILHDESSLARVIDPGGGSWYVESLTHDLAQRAWSTFTAIERHGGALAYVDGELTNALARTRGQRDEQIAKRRAPITGVSEFAFLEEQPVTRPTAPRPAGTGPVAPRRYAEPFEALRDRADAAEVRPTVFLAALGPAAVHSARAGFAANLFAAGGIRSITGTGSVDEIAKAFTDSGCALACICSSDKLYAESAAELAAALKAAGATQVWLAGKAEVAGVDARIFAGCDALVALRAAYDVVEAGQ